MKWLCFPRNVLRALPTYSLPSFTLKEASVKMFW